MSQNQYNQQQNQPKRRLLSRLIQGQTIDHMVALLWSSVAIRCVFALSLALTLNLLYLVWKMLILKLPILWPFVDLYFLKHEILLSLRASVLYVVVMWMIWQLRHFKALQCWVEFLCLQMIAICMAYQGYVFGSVSVVTGMLLMCSAVIGLVLFSRLALYSAVVTGVSFLMATAYAYRVGDLPYAPKFIYTDMPKLPDDATFVMVNNFLFSAPIFLGGLLLIDFFKTSLKKREAELNDLARLDPLTQVYNRHMIYEYMKNPILPIQSASQHSSDAIILLDMDFFKSINDQYGHQTGDQVLVEAAKILRQHIREHDVLARFGGEEFIIVLPATSLAVAYRVAERCREAIAALELTVSGVRLQFTASFGIALSDQRDQLDRRIDQADQALYQAKKRGRNCTVIYSTDFLVEAAP